MQNILLVIHIIVALSIITLVLLQQGKGAETGASFGSGASGTIFGAQGSGNFLSHATAICAAIFMLTSLSLGYFTSHTNTGTDKLLQQLEEQVVPNFQENKIPD